MFRQFSAKSTIAPTKSCATEILLAFFFTVILLLLSGYLLSYHKVQIPDTQSLATFFLPIWVKYLSPKPNEHFIYLSLLILFPFLNYFAIQFTRAYIPKKIKENLFTHLLLTTFLSILIAMSFFIKPDYIKVIFGNIYNIYLISLLIIASLMLSFQFIYQKSYIPWKLLNHTIFHNDLLQSIFFKYIKTYQFFKQSRRTTNSIIFWSFILFSVIFQTISFKIVNVNLVNSDGAGAWAVHFQAVYYAITQVFGGKTLLSDLPAQYGLYAEILKPIFIVLSGISVLKFTAVMGILQIIGLLSLTYVAYKYIRNSLILFIVMMGLCLITGLTWVAISVTWEPLYQISPIRFVFPAVSIFLFSLLIKNLSMKNIFAFSIICGFAILWNMDSGIPVYGAFFCYLITLLIFPKVGMTKTDILKLMSIAIFTTILTIGTFISYLQYKSILPLNFVDAFKYQNIFYVTGFGMLPIERGLAPWQVICGLYVFGITLALYSWIHKTRMNRLDLIFYISIMGLGLFSYHEGRSHTWTLIAVSWPAFFIAFIILDYVYELIRLKKLSRFFLIPCIPVLIFGVLCSISYLYGFPTLINYATLNWSSILKPQKTTITQNINFIHDKVGNDKQVIILAPHQAVYYGELGLTSPLKGPGNIEIILKADWDYLVVQLLASPQKHIFVELKNSSSVPKEYTFLLQKYKIEDKNGSLFYLINKES